MQYHRMDRTETAIWTSVVLLLPMCRMADDSSVAAIVLRRHNLVSRVLGAQAPVVTPFALGYISATGPSRMGHFLVEFVEDKPVG